MKVFSNFSSNATTQFSHRPRPARRPKVLPRTGDPSFCTLWTLCGMPAISLPLLQSANGLPIGVQLVGPRHGDARLLRTARWLAAKMAES